MLRTPTLLITLYLLAACSSSVEPEAALPQLSGRWIGSFEAVTDGTRFPDSIHATIRQELDGDLSGLGTYSLMFDQDLAAENFVRVPGRYYGTLVPPRIVTLRVDTPTLNGCDWQADGTALNDSTMELFVWVGRRKVELNLYRCSVCSF